MKKFVYKYCHVIFLVLAVILFALSFTSYSYDKRLKREVAQVENSLHKRELIAEQYAYRAISSDADWMEFKDLPDDIVLYCYDGDSLKFWVHEFPISNDDIEAYHDRYRLQFMSNRNLYAQPLAYIGYREKYVNLGSSWYVVTTQFSENRYRKVVTGILIRTDYPIDGLTDKVNPKLKLRRGYSTASINDDDRGIVYGIEKEPLFSIVAEDDFAVNGGNMPLRWVAFALAILGAFCLHCTRRTWKTFWISIAVFLAVGVIVNFQVAAGISKGNIFSPILYADNVMMNSLGSLLLNNLFVALTAYCLFILRKRIYHKSASARKVGRKAIVAAFILLTGFLAYYIHATIHSLVINSNIVLEPFRISDIDGYSLLCFLALALLFLALLEMMQLTIRLITGVKRINLFSWRCIIAYTVIISLYTVFTIGEYGLQREYESNRVNTGKLAIERDLPLELFLREVEPAIANDPFIAVLSSVNGADLIRNRLLERYLYSDIIKKYNIRLTICAPNSLLSLGRNVQPVGCFPFYDDMIKEYGVPLADKSGFFYLNNYNGLTSYIGVFTYFDNTTYQVSRLYLEVESKYPNNVVTNPFDALNIHTQSGMRLPMYYSYARYANGRLVNYGGKYDYPVNPEEWYRDGYSMDKRNGYIHFVNKVSDEDITVITRELRPATTYIVSFSYFVIFFGLFLILCTVWGRKDRLFALPKHSIRRRITFIITFTMAVALLAIGAGSVRYVMDLIRGQNRDRMSEMVTAVQASLSEYCKYALKYNELETSELFAAVDQVADVLMTDINLYNVEGELIRSTKPELFEQFIVGNRMNHEAYKAVKLDRSLRYSGLEEIAGLQFFSVYAPLFNDNGDMVAIVNVPYFSDSQEMINSGSNTLSMMINVYLILILAALALGALLSNSISRPLIEIKRRIDTLALNGRSNQHIRYRNKKDELGVLIQSYNRMVDELEESTRRLAQSEREQAWKEMARQIAHEIKNPLTPMRLSIQHLMRLKAENAPGWQEKLDKVSRTLLEQIDTLAETASEFSSFARNFSEEVTDVDVGEVIREQIALFSNRDDIRLTYSNSLQNPVISARKGQITRVFVNLITNSIQAIDSVRDTGGCIDVSMYGEDGLLCVDVEDDGPGVSEDNLDKLFVPNFTTKSSGSGLGLAISRGIVEQSDGTVNYSRSQRLGGARFSIRIPLKKG